ncbi:unnamed protein product, partial [Timema podura]|nr:unnamed protein product [Timema podura]
SHVRSRGYGTNIHGRRSRTAIKASPRAICLTLSLSTITLPPTATHIAGTSSCSTATHVAGTSFRSTATSVAGTSFRSTATNVAGIVIYINQLPPKSKGWIALCSNIVASIQGLNSVLTLLLQYKA